jgi:hypothetical protein
MLDRGQLTIDGIAGASEAFIVEPTPDGWPNMAGPAFSGITGEIARLATANSEADPIAVATTNLIWAGAVFGRTKYQWIGDSVHHGRVFGALVGNSSVARKGTSLPPVKRIWTKAQNFLSPLSSKPFPLGYKLKVVNGLSTGEGLVYAIRDPQEEQDGVDAEALDPGEPDKRLLVIETELANVFNHFKRQGNNLSPVLRQMWDGESVSPLTKTSRIAATDPHVCIIGHITQAELLSSMGKVNLLNGLANRFLWILVRRPKLVPNPLPMPDSEVERIGEELARLTIAAHSMNERCGQLVFSNSAEALWGHVYPELVQEHRGILGPILARGAPYVRRLAQIYCQLDGKDMIAEEHLESALAIWRYSQDSSRLIFGDREINRDADRILDFLDEGPKTREQLRGGLFRGNLLSKELDALLDDLQRSRFIICEKKRAPSRRGRPTSIYRRVL